MRIYSLQHPNEEVLAAACAKTSRDSRPFDEIMKTIDDDKAQGFLERVFNGYNDASVADIAVPTVALEGVSILASKALESNRRGFYQEKSTRYQVFTKDSVYSPDPEKFSAEEITLYRQAVEASFEAYERLTPPMMAWAEKVIPADAKNRVGAVRGKAFDSLRYFLPCGTTTQLAARMPANDWRDLIQTLYAEDEPEFTAIADRIREVLQEVVPTLVKRAEPNWWLNRIRDHQTLAANRTNSHDLADRRRLSPRQVPWSVKSRGEYGDLYWTREELKRHQEEERSILGLLAFRYSGQSMRSSFNVVDASPETMWQLYDDLMLRRRTRHDKVPQELEALHYTFEIVMDYGAYRDLQRQRRCTILPQPMTPYLGFQIPEGALDAGLGGAFEKALTDIGVIAQKLGDMGSKLAAYATPLGYNHRSVHIYDGAQMYYVGELRTGPGCHISYWRVVHEMVRQVQAVHPRLFKHVKLHEPSFLTAHS